jgi:Zn-dependent protease with chaperone function
MTTTRGSLHPKVLTRVLALLLAVPASSVFAQTQVKPGWNIFSVEQDVEIGRQSAAEAERQLPLLQDPAAQRYVQAIGARLAAQAPGPKFPYQFKVTNLSDINAFALPGGFLYVNRGLIETVRSEAELAGVLSHEIAHVALRHSTANVSKAYLAQAGVGILGGLLGGQSATTRGIIEAVGGFGLNALFLKYSRTAEEQADIVGTQIMAKGGYDPLAMATMFQMLQERGRREPSKLEQFFSSHPAPANREARVRQEAALVQASARRAGPVGDIEQVKTSLRRLPPAPTMEQVARGTAPTTTGRAPAGGTSTGTIAAPSSRFQRFRQRTNFFEIDYPENWRPYEDQRGHGVTIVPEGGVVQLSNGQQSLIYGVVVNHYVPFEGQIGPDVFGGSQPDTHLEDASDDLVRELTSGNPHLRLVPNSKRRQTIDQMPALSLVLAGRSQVTGQEERVTVFTRELADHHVLYSLFIAPAKDYTALSRTFQRMISSLDVNDRAAHQ